MYIYFFGLLSKIFYKIVFILLYILEKLILLAKPIYLIANLVA